MLQEKRTTSSRKAWPDVPASGANSPPPRPHDQTIPFRQCVFPLRHPSALHLKKDSPEPSATESDVPDNASSPSIRSAHTLLTAQPDGTINQSNTDVPGVASGHTAPEKGTMRSDDEVALGRLSPTRGTASSAKPTSTVASPSTASLLSYEFSNVRVSEPVSCADNIALLTRTTASS
ncbi:vesicle mediated transport protein Vid24 [Aspergillus fumigatus]|nr:vesicle mediated transport protein Vid24 [Aspergillus fumigatus]